MSEVEAKKIYYGFFDELSGVFSEQFIAQHLAIVYVDDTGKFKLYPTDCLEDFSEFNLENESDEDDSSYDYIEKDFDQEQEKINEDDPVEKKKQRRCFPSLRHQNK